LCRTSPAQQLIAPSRRHAIDLSADSLIASLAVSSVGFALFMYGKKQVRVPQYGVGMVLMVAPYFTTTAGATFGLAGVLLCGLIIAVRSGI